MHTTGITPHILKCEPGWTGSFCDQQGSAEFKPITSDFKDPDNFEGWTCGKITTCGKFGNICGGFNTKAKSHDITKTFTVTAGTYSISLDFVKIDSWLVFDAVFWLVRMGVCGHEVIGCWTWCWCRK